MNTEEFKEVQRFRTWWAWAGIGALNILFLYAIVQQLILGRPFGEKPAPGLVLVLVELFLLAMFFFLVSMRLNTKINETGIYYRFYPFPTCSLGLGDQLRISSRKKGPVPELSGAGRRPR